ncbi:hypothetical protein FHS27_001614 [Rhodopirellula rubra]|uniref:Uncharacterized protein n=1 Tax=Aporhodopirellula rubra TaxID=980271 RepID=A0A7W5H5D9_9BACT|nr:hypothetical protein [Aporhodopirellula rubra]
MLFEVTLTAIQVLNGTHFIARRFGSATTPRDASRFSYGAPLLPPFTPKTPLLSTLFEHEGTLFDHEGTSLEHVGDCQTT